MSVMKGKLIKRFAAGVKAKLWHENATFRENLKLSTPGLEFSGEIHFEGKRRESFRCSA